MRSNVFRRCSVAAVLVVVLGLLAPLAAMAEPISNDLDASVDGDREALSISVGQQSTVTYRVIPGGGDGDADCNFDPGDTLTLNIYILDGNTVRSPQANAAVTTDKTQLVFTDCTTPQTITFTGLAVTGQNPGNVAFPNFRLFLSCRDLTLNAVNSGPSTCLNSVSPDGWPTNQTNGSFNLAPATHDVIVTPDSTPPITTVTALTNPGTATYTSDTWVNENVDLTFNVDDGTGSGFAELSVTRSLNGATPTPVMIGNGGTLSISDEGTTTVTYQATDNASNQETLQTFIVKIDKTAPSITAPGDITVNATSPDGAVVFFDAPVTSDNLTTVTTTCDAASGDLFAVGTTTVTCTATDEANNSSQDTFTVTVVGAEGQLDELYTMVQNTDISGSASTANSVRRNLLAQVSLAQALESYGQNTLTCLSLTRLELEIRGQVSRRRISTSDAEALWAKIDEIQSALGCGGQTPT